MFTDSDLNISRYLASLEFYEEIYVLIKRNSSNYGNVPTF